MKQALVGLPTCLRIIFAFSSLNFPVLQNISSLFINVFGTEIGFVTIFTPASRPIITLPPPSPQFFVPVFILLGNILLSYEKICIGTVLVVAKPRRFDPVSKSKTSNRDVYGYLKLLYQ